jgi:hypothetical protein
MASTWLHDQACTDKRWYRHPDVICFHTAVIRTYRAMRKYQRCQVLHLDTTRFPRPQCRELWVWMCCSADNEFPRVTCQDREMVLRPVSPRLFGVDPAIHVGSWLSLPFILSFLVGLTDDPVQLEEYVCPNSFRGTCTGRKTKCIPKELKVSPVQM